MLCEVLSGMSPTGTSTRNVHSSVTLERYTDVVTVNLSI